VDRKKSARFSRAMLQGIEVTVHPPQVHHRVDLSDSETGGRGEQGRGYSREVILRPAEGARVCIKKSVA
jgi:hypothetical protein